MNHIVPIIVALIIFGGTLSVGLQNAPDSEIIGCIVISGIFAGIAFCGTHIGQYLLGPAGILVVYSLCGLITGVLALMGAYTA